MQGKKAASTVAIAAVLATAVPNQSAAGPVPGVAPAVEDNGSVARIRIKAPRGIRMGVQDWPDRCAVSVTASAPVSWSLDRVRKRLGVGSIIGDSLVDADGFVAAIPCGASVRTTYSKGSYVVTVRPKASARKSRAGKPDPVPSPSDMSLAASVKEAVRTAVEFLNGEGNPRAPQGKAEAGGKDRPGPVSRNEREPTRKAASASARAQPTVKAPEPPSVAGILTEDRSPKAAPQQPAGATPASSVRIAAPLGKADVREGAPIDKEEVSLAKARALLADGRPEEAREVTRRLRTSGLLPNDAAEAELIEQSAQLMMGHSIPAAAVSAAAAADKGWTPFEVLRLSLEGDTAAASALAPAAVVASRGLPPEAAWRLLPYIAEAAYAKGDRMTVIEAARQIASLRTNTGPDSNAGYVKGLNEAILGRHGAALSAFEEAGRGTGPWRDKSRILAVRELGLSGKGDGKEQEARYVELLSATRGTRSEADVLTALGSLRKSAGDAFGALAAYERLAEVSKGTQAEPGVLVALKEAVDGAYSAAEADPRLAGKLLKVHESYGSQGSEETRRRRSDQFAGIIAKLGLSPDAGPKPAPVAGAEPMKTPAPGTAEMPGPAEHAQPPKTKPMAEDRRTEETREIPQKGTELAAVRDRQARETSRHPAKDPKPASEAARPKGSVEKARELWNAGDMAGAAREYKGAVDGGSTLDGLDAARWAAAALSSGDDASARAAAEIAGGPIRDAILSAGNPSTGVAAPKARAANPVEAARSALDSAAGLLDAHGKQFPRTEGE